MPPRDDQGPRFYHLVLQEDLLGGWHLLREWGAQGRRGTVRRDHYDTRDDALAAMLETRDRQLARGYQVMYREGGRMEES